MFMRSLECSRWFSGLLSMSEFSLVILRVAFMLVLLIVSRSLSGSDFTWKNVWLRLLSVFANRIWDASSSRKAVFSLLKLVVSCFRLVTRSNFNSAWVFCRLFPSNSSMKQSFWLLFLKLFRRWLCSEWSIDLIERWVFCLLKVRLWCCECSVMSLLDEFKFCKWMGSK